MRRVARVLFVAALSLGDAAALATGDALSSADRGRVLYAERCAACHDHPADRTPPRIFIATLRSPEEVVAALTLGVMRQQADGLNASDVAALATFLTGREPQTAEFDVDANRCRGEPPPVQERAGDWNGWGRDERNTRFQPDPRLRAQDLARLRVRWVFAYPGRSSFGQPVVVGGRVFTGGAAGVVFSLDARSGCTWWSYKAEANVRSAVVVASVRVRDRTRAVAFFGGDRGLMHALDARTGAPLWVRRVDEHPFARVFGTPKFHAGVLYVPVSSTESTAAGDPRYACCTFRGQLLALDPATGREIWRSSGIDGPLVTVRAKADGEPIRGPAGAAIFSSPTIDARRGVIYAGTGNSYTNQPEQGSDAILALARGSGEKLWVRQVVSGDAWVQGCVDNPRGNCPVPLGFDYGFASSTILVERPGRSRVLLAPSKSGVLYALDPDDHGRVLWEVPLQRGSANGGILWGAAIEGDRVFVGTSDYDYVTGRGNGDVVALDIDSGHIAWRSSGSDLPCAWGGERCARTYVAALTTIPGAVLAGGLDGVIRAFATHDGRLLWEGNLGGAHRAVNADTASAGGIDYGGQIVAQGMVFVQASSGRQPGNALIALALDDRHKK